MKKKDAMSSDASGWGVTPGGRVTPQEVQQKEFRVARFGAGYRMREVDEFLDQVTDALSALVAENERLRQGDATSAPSSPPASIPAPSDDAGRAAVEAFLRREKGFLQDLGGLVQTHAEGLRTMVREARREAVGAAVEPAPEDDRVEVPEPEADEPTESARPVSDAVEDDVDADMDEDDGERSEDLPTATMEAVTEEPIRVDEPEPARSKPADREDDGSLRELFWGEE